MTSGSDIAALVEKLRGADKAIDGTLISRLSHSEAGREGAKLVVNLKAASQNLASALSHPEPVEQEAVAWKEFDHTTIDNVLRYGGRCRECADHLGLCPNGLPCDVDDAKTAIRWVLKALNYGITNGFLPHPSPSPEQGGEEIIAPAECDPNCDDPECPYSHQPLTLRTAYDNAIYRLSTLRARVAELEARATPQAGASAEPVAWMSGYPHNTCLTISAPLRDQDNWWVPLYLAPNSDAMRALRNIAEGNLGDAPWQANYEKIREVARAALSGKGGSNGQ